MNGILWPADIAADDFRGFQIDCQPICDTKTLKVKGAEVRLRFSAPDGSSVSDTELIPLLEATGKMAAVGMWMLEQAICACLEWCKTVPHFVAAVKVSYRQLCAPQFCEQVQTLIDNYGLSPGHLLLELSESDFLSEEKTLRAPLGSLRKKGLLIAIDDFGAEYAALSQLRQFELDVIKIGKSLMKTLGASQYNRELLNSVVRLCHQTAKRVCINGVETRGEQLEVCLLNIDCIQGSYVSGPVSREDFDRIFISGHYDRESLVVTPSWNSRRKQLEGDSDLLMSLMNAMPLCLNLWSRDFEILACNQEVMRLFGVHRPEDFKERFYRFSPEFQPDGMSSIQKSRQMVSQTFETGKTTFFWMHCLESGEKIPAEVCLVRIPYLQDYVVVSYTQDLRERCANEERIQKFNSRLHSILNATPLCLNLWTRNYKNSMCNQAALKLFNLKSAEEYLEKFDRLSPLCQPDGTSSMKAAQNKIQEAFQTGACQFRWMHCNMDGDPIPAEISLVRIEGLDDDGGDMVAGFTRDLRPQLIAEQAERVAAKRIEAVLDAMPLTCLLWNLEGEAIDCNQAAVSMFEAINKMDVILNFDDFLPKWQPDGLRSMIKKAAKLREVREFGSCAFEWVYQSRKKTMIPCAVSLFLLHISDEEMIVAYSQDLRELQQTLEINKRLQQMAYFDGLTGSVSRARFMEDCTSCFRTLQEGACFALLIFDFDDFKGLNDTYGHECGDMVLKGVVQKILSLLPKEAMLGRYGGDEFLIRIREMERPKLDAWILEILTAVREMYFSKGKKRIRTTISVGGAYWGPTCTELETLISQADQALYEAKRRGRNCGVLL